MLSVVMFIMVNVEIINKIFDELIIKCRKSGGLSTRVKGRLNHFAEESRGYRKEKGLIINANGEILLERQGTETKVQYTVSEIKELIEKTGLMGDFHKEHNHPTPYISAKNEENLLPTCLSEADIDNLQECWVFDDKNGDELYITPFKSITCECPNGSRMTLNRIGIGDENTVRNASIDPDVFKYDAFHRKFNQARDNLQIAHSNFIHNLIDTGGYIDSHMDNWYKEWNKNNQHNQKILHQEPIDWGALESPSREEYNRERDKYIQEYTRNNYKYYIENSIKEWQELGFELSVEWTR